jgi:hypothetical protein
MTNYKSSNLDSYKMVYLLDALIGEPMGIYFPA